MSERMWVFLRQIIYLAIGIGFLFGCLRSEGQHPTSLRFDVNWWQQANSDEQQGFIYGYIDCRRPSKSAGASIVDYQNAVSAILKQKETNSSGEVTEAIDRALTVLKSKASRSGENYSGLHGFLDGEWWGEFSGSRPWKIASNDRGYVEGYLACGTAPVTDETVREYQSAINRYYALGHHSHDKIADVLQRLLKPTTRSLE
jgi:hypothetical protein